MESLVSRSNYYFTGNERELKVNIINKVLLYEDFMISYLNLLYMRAIGIEKRERTR